MDAALLDAVVNEELAKRTITGPWTGSFLGLTVEATYSVKASNAALTVVPGQDGQLQGTATVNGEAHADVKLGSWKLASATATVKASPTLHATASVTTGNQIVVKLDRIDSATFQFDFNNVPPVFDNLISDIVNGLGGTIITAINNELAKVAPLPVVTIPAIPISVGGETITISLAGADIATLTTPDGKTLLALTGNPSVNVTSAVHAAVAAEPAMV